MITPVRSLLRSTPAAPWLVNVAANGPRFLWHLSWLSRSEWYSLDRLRAFQERRLRTLLSHAYARSPYYRKEFDRHGVRLAQVQTLNDLAELPILRRQAAVERFDEIRATNAADFEPHRGATSGTSGVRLEFLRDRETASVGNAARARFRAWHGIRFGHRIAEFRGMLLPSSGLPDYATEIVYEATSRTLRLNLLGFPQRQARMADAVSQFRPEAVVTGSPAALAHFSLFLLKHPHYQVRPRVVFSGGERLFSDQRDIMREAFDAPVVEGYGNWEYVVFGGECPQGRLHIASEMGIVEILKGGRPCPPGEVGEIVVTSLWNRSFPFIRYAIGDIGCLDNDLCPCGRGLPTWRIVGGRERDLLATPDGYLYLPLGMVSVPRWRGKIAGLRFFQETRDAVVAQVVRGPAFTDEDTAALHADLNHHLEGRLRISIQFCDSLEQTAGGKYRFVDSRVPIQV